MLTFVAPRNEVAKFCHHLLSILFFTLRSEKAAFYETISNASIVPWDSIGVLRQAMSSLPLRSYERGCWQLSRDVAWLSSRFAGDNERSPDVRRSLQMSVRVFRWPRAGSGLHVRFRSERQTIAQNVTPAFPNSVPPDYFFTSGHSLAASGLAASSGEMVATSL